MNLKMHHGRQVNGKPWSHQEAKIALRKNMYINDTDHLNMLHLPLLAKRFQQYPNRLKTKRKINESTAAVC